MDNHCTAIIPFYNEGNRLLYTLEQLQKVPSLHHLIVVDDGSSDGIFRKIKQAYPKITVIRLEKNQGKSKAISLGLTKVKTPYVYLCDADLTNIRPEEIEKILTSVSQKNTIDMVITARSHSPLLSQITRSHILLSGERLLKTNILREALKKNPVRYQIEAVINEYCLHNKCIVYWTSGNAQNTFKIYKFGFVAGIIKEVQMIESILKKIGFRHYMRQVAQFARTPMHTN